MVNFAKPLSGKATVFGLTKFHCLLLVEALLFISLAFSVASIFVPNWRLGDGSSFMFPPGLVQGFQSRSYGLIYVEGLRKISWAELATSVCDRWGLYSNTASLFELAPMCSPNSPNPTECTSLFATHMRNRCESYSAITLISWIVVAVLSISTIMVAFTSIVSLVISLGVWKRFVLASLISASALSLSALIVWAVLTQHYLSQLIDTATFPSAPLSLGFFLAAGSCLALLTATFVFWRLSTGLKAKADRMSVSQAKLLDIAERRFFSHEVVRLIDDSDDET